MPPLPSHIGRYEIKSLIGRGGMGNLYLAHDPNTNRLVAIKLLSAGLDSDEFRERFVREARALAALNHPNIVNIYDTGEFESSPFIVMEYVRGETLAEVIKRRAPLFVSQKLKWMMELCAGMAQAHEVGIIHRDVKPANLIVDQQGRLKILDFGIARVTDDGKTLVGPLTQVNVAIGTPGYMSPEQIEGGEVDHRSDIFAVGAVCYELISYCEAFGGRNTREIERQVLAAKPRSLATLVPGLDPEIDDVVLRALKREPDKRYQDAASFERAMDRLRAKLGPEALDSSVRPTPPPPSGSRGKSREMRAEAAYQRALAARHSGAQDAAKRFAVEALAEDPTHKEARALLAGLDLRPLNTQVSTPAVSAERPRTSMTTSAGDAESTMASAKTVVVSRGKREVGAAGGAEAIGAQRSNRSARARPIVESIGERVAALVPQLKPITERYPLLIPAVVLAVLVIGVAAAGMVLSGGLWSSGYELAITRPMGGTVTGPGIRCGTAGTECTSTRSQREPIELTPEPDTGYVFVGYTGDCAPSGRTLMTTARTCGATFAQAQPTQAAATQPLSISPVPTNGTLESLDIICGTKGTACSANHPDGVPVTLHATADEGFTFTGFLGDCSALGLTQMNGPRTCSATFEPTAKVSNPPPVPPRNGPGNHVKEPQQVARNPDGRPPPPPPPPPGGTSGGPGRQNPVSPPVAPPKDNKMPESEEEFAKRAITTRLKDWCDAHESIDPEGVQRVFPRVDIGALKNQLNKSKYRSVTCKLSEPVFVTLDAGPGKAKTQVEVTRVYEHTHRTQKPDTSELIATMTWERPGARSPWQIARADYKPKPK